MLKFGNMVLIEDNFFEKKLKKKPLQKERLERIS